jgi:hypothetical protein
MTASTRIFEEQRGQTTNGLSPFAAQTAAACEVDLVDFAMSLAHAERQADSGTVQVGD